MTSKQYVLSRDPNSKLSKYMDRGNDITYKVISRSGSFNAFAKTSKKAWDAMRDTWIEHESSELRGLGF